MRKVRPINAEKALFYMIIRRIVRSDVNDKQNEDRNIKKYPDKRKDERPFKRAATFVFKGNKIFNERIRREKEPYAEKRA